MGWTSCASWTLQDALNDAVDGVGLVELHIGCAVLVSTSCDPITREVCAYDWSVQATGLRASGHITVVLLETSTPKRHTSTSILTVRDWRWKALDERDGAYVDALPQAVRTAWKSKLAPTTHEYALNTRRRLGFKV